MFIKYSVYYLIGLICFFNDYMFIIQIYTFLLFNELKREVSNVLLYNFIWTINYSYSYSYSYWHELVTVFFFHFALA